MKKVLGILLSVLMIASLLVGCKTDGGSSKDTNVLTIANDADAITFDPMGSNDNASSKVLLQVYEGLFDLSPKGEVIPLLCESYDKKSDTEYVFHLKKGVKFHNGEEMKASDVVFSIKRACDAPNVKHLFNTIDKDSVKADDDYTVSIKLIHPFGGIISAFMHPGGSILSEKAVNAAGKNYGQSPETVVGTGPFRLVEWSKANAIKFDRYEDYHAEKAGVEKIVYKIIPEPTNRVVELETGGADIAYEIQPIDIKKIQENPDLELLSSLDYGTTYLGFNTSKEPFNNPKVREAISYGIDMQGIIDKVWLGVGKAATNSLPPTLKYSIADNYKVKERDVEKAKKLLAEAGYPNGFECSISTNEKKQRVDMATIIKEQLKEIGIDVTVQVMEWSAFNDVLKNAQQDMFEIAWISDTPDPDTFLFPCFHSSAKGEGGNYCYLEDDELDKLLEDARRELDDTKRAELYKKAQERIHETVAWIPQYWSELAVGVSNRVQGFEINPFGYYKLKNVKLVNN